jgi:hypothetical protein
MSSPISPMANTLPGQSAVQQPVRRHHFPFCQRRDTRPCSTRSPPPTCRNSAVTAPTASPTPSPGAAMPTPGRSSTASSISSAARLQGRLRDRRKEEPGAGRGLLERRGRRQQQFRPALEALIFRVPHYQSGEELAKAVAEARAKGARQVKSPRLIQIAHEDPASDPGRAARRFDQRRPRAIPPKYLYDALGSRLFSAITELPEYYPTRTEAAIFVREMNGMARAMGPVSTLVDLGAGNCEKAASLFETVQACSATSRSTFRPTTCVIRWSACSASIRRWTCWASASIFRRR